MLADLSSRSTVKPEIYINIVINQDYPVYIIYGFKTRKSDKIPFTAFDIVDGKNEHWNLPNVIGSSLYVNLLARSPGQLKLDSDKWKLWKNLFEYIIFFSKFGFRTSRWKKIWQRLRKIKNKLLQRYSNYVSYLFYLDEFCGWFKPWIQRVSNCSLYIVVDSLQFYVMSSSLYIVVDSLQFDVTSSSLYIVVDSLQFDVMSSSLYIVVDSLQFDVMSSSLYIVVDSPINCKQIKYFDQSDNSSGCVLGFKKYAHRWSVGWNYEPWHDPKQDVVTHSYIIRKKRYNI